MRHSFYRIADLQIAVHSQEEMCNDSFEVFRCEDMGCADIEFILEEKIEEANFKAVYHEMNVYWNTDADGNFVIDVFGSDADMLLSRMFVDRGFTKAKIQRSPCAVQSPDDYVFGLFGEIVFRNHILCRNGIVLHAAAINFDGEGILFSGPSGEGKTTQASLWNEHMNAHTINGDRPPLMFDRNGTLRVHGSAWSGSDRIFRNESVPLKAIVFVQQHHENVVSRLSPDEAVSYLIPRAFIPYFDQDLMENGMRNLENILYATNTYLLRCRPDRGAIESLRDALLGTCEVSRCLSPK